jgi:trans-aconitate methyltransferase
MVTGIDISERCIEIAAECNPMMEFLRLDLLDWKPDSNSIDGIVAYYSIIYSPKNDVQKLFDNFRAALVPEGKLLVVVKKGIFEGYQKKVLGTNVRSYFAEYQEHEIENIVAESGFSIDEIITRSPYRNEIQNERIYCLCSNRV